MLPFDIPELIDYINIIETFTDYEVVLALEKYDEKAANQSLNK